MREQCLVVIYTATCCTLQAAELCLSVLIVFRVITFGVCKRRRACDWNAVSRRAELDLESSRLAQERPLELVLRGLDDLRHGLLAQRNVVALQRHALHDGRRIRLQDDPFQWAKVVEIFRISSGIQRS